MNELLNELFHESIRMRIRIPEPFTHVIITASVLPFMA